MAPVFSTAEIFREALEQATRDALDDEAYWACVAGLQKCPPSEVWKALVPLAIDADPRLRALVPDTLRYLGAKPQPLLAETLDLFRDMLRVEQSPQVIAAIGCAFVDIGHEAAIELMVPFATHADASVRSAVVHALLGHNDERAIQTLIHLSRDEDDDIRDWACFGLGSQLGEPGDNGVVDTPEIREALAARLSDPFEKARNEALVGLAMRRDERAIPALKAALAAEPIAEVLLEAAFHLRSPELCAPLRALAARGAADSETMGALHRAIAACCGVGEHDRFRGPP